jgi:hypothetical protein
VNTRILGVVMLGLALSGCGWFKGDKPEKIERVDVETVRKVAKVARAVRAEPSSTSQVLKKAEMSRAEFDELLYAIAADPAASDEYARLIELEKPKKAAEEGVEGVEGAPVDPAGVAAPVEIGVAPPEAGAVAPAEGAAPVE